jgi:hypothetical protein
MMISSNFLLQNLNLVKEVQQNLVYLSFEVDNADKSWVNSAIENFELAQNKWLFDLYLIMKNNEKPKSYEKIIENILRAKKSIQNIGEDYQELNPFFQEIFKAFDIIENSVNLSLKAENEVVFEQNLADHLKFSTSQIVN